VAFTILSLTNQPFNFEKVKLGEIICIYSDLTVGELDNAPQKVRDYFAALPTQHLEYVRMTDESLTSGLYAPGNTFTKDIISYEDEATD
jgi:hypothetical protein